MYDEEKSLWYPLGANRIHARKWGNGSTLLLCLHGYSNNSSMFAGMQGLLGRDWTVIAMDLPGHGQTEWSEPATITPADLQDLAKQLCRTNGVEQFSILAFSLGGRFALSMLTAAPASIQKMVLAAPDGLSSNPAYRLFNGSYTGQKIFQKVLQKPERFTHLLDVLANRKMLSDQKAQFYKYHLSSPVSTRLMSGIWVSMGKMYPTGAEVEKVLSQYPVPVHLLMGTFDPVIPITLGERFQAAHPQWVVLHRLSKAHRVLDSEGFELAAKLLQS